MPSGLHAELATARGHRRVAPSREVRAAERPIREGRRSRSTLRRQAISRRSLALADMVAAGLALALCVGALSHDDSLHLTTLLALPLVVVAGKIQRIYERDELVLNKSTIDEAPNSFSSRPFYALIVYVFDDQLLSGALGSGQMLLLWLTLFFFAVIARWVARAARAAGARAPSAACSWAATSRSSACSRSSRGTTRAPSSSAACRWPRPPTRR